jgi:glycosyltransferase involved in cell wall biosynthesis
LDIRTGSIKTSYWRRWIEDALLICESKVFRHVVVLSESLARKLGLTPGRYRVLPLGADVLADNEKRFDALRLLYVGTLSGRQIEKTILGFAEFHRRHKGEIEMSYTIAGDGYRGELDQLKHLADELGLGEVVKCLGFVNHADLAPYWRDCNVGVSFIPINDIYDCQPATKTFEYLLAGMPVIATGTLENARVVNQDNGVLIDDSAQAFCNGIETIWLNRSKYNSGSVRATSASYRWKNIVYENLLPYLASQAGPKAEPKI